MHFFFSGLEICYENLFFARENGAEPPRLILDDVDTKAYNTIKFKQSQGVAAFNKILEDEKETSKDRVARPMTMYSPRKAGNVVPTINLNPIDAPVREKPAVAPRPDKVPGGPAQLAPINNFAMKMNLLAKERELKKVEAQKKMDDILSARYQAQKRERELQRTQVEEEKSRQRATEIDALSEPLWMQNLKNKKKF